VYGDHLSIYSRGQNKVGQCFFANVNLLALSMVTMKIFIYYSNPGLLNSILAKFLNKTCPTLFWPPLYNQTHLINYYNNIHGPNTHDNDDNTMF
jgi:hypothetical protein